MLLKLATKDPEDLLAFPKNPSTYLSDNEQYGSMIMRKPSGTQNGNMKS